MASEFVFVDRYSATGTPYPEPDTVCLGQCEGMGCVPIADPERKGKLREMKRERPEFIQLWNEAHAEQCCVSGVLRSLWQNREWWFWKSIGRDVWNVLKGGKFCDGWHFVKCPDCDGTGKRPNTGSEEQR